MPQRGHLPFLITVASSDAPKTCTSRPKCPKKYGREEVNRIRQAKKQPHRIGYAGLRRPIACCLSRIRKFFSSQFARQMTFRTVHRYTSSNRGFRSYPTLSSALMAQHFVQIERLQSIEILRLQSEDGTNRLTLDRIIALTQTITLLAGNATPLVIA